MSEGGETRAQRRDGEVRTAVSDGMVALLKDYYGVGPTQSKTYYHDDLVVCLLRGGFTRVEETLLNAVREAATKAKELNDSEMQRISSGFQMPGMF